MASSYRLGRNIASVFLFMGIVTLAISLTHAYVLVGDDNTFVQGSRTTFTFDIDMDLSPQMSRTFTVAAGEYHKDSPIIFDNTSYLQKGTLHSWPVFIDIHLWGSKRKQSPEAECWLHNDDKRNHIGSIAIKVPQTEEFFFPSSIPHFQISFTSSLRLTSGTMVKCYLQTVTGSYLNNITIDDTKVNIIPDKSITIIKNIRQGPTFPLLELPFTITNTQPYGVYDLQYTGLIDFHFKDTRNKRQQQTKMTKISDDVLKSSLESNMASSSSSSSSSSLGDSPIVDLPLKLPAQFNQHHAGAWSQYKHIWMCQNNKARIYSFPFEHRPWDDDDASINSPYGNLKYILLVDETVATDESIQCTLPIHAMDILPFDSYQNDKALTNKIYPGSFIHHELSIERPLNHLMSSMVRIGNSISYNTSYNTYYMHSQLLSKYALIDKLLHCKPTKIGPYHGSYEYECQYNSAHRISSLRIIDPTKIDTRLFIHDNSYPIRDIADFNHIIIPTTDGLTYKDGVFTFDLSQWINDPTSPGSRQKFAFIYSPYGTEYQDKYISLMASIDILYVTQLKDGTTYDKARTGTWDTISFFGTSMQFDTTTQYTIEPKKHILELTTTSKSFISQDNIIPVEISPFDHLTTSTLHKMVKNIPDDIKCTVTLGKIDIIKMKYRKVLDLPVWTADIKGAFSSPDHGITVKCIINIDIVDYYKPTFIHYALYNVNISHGDIKVIYNTEKDILDSLYKPVAIIRGMYTKKFPQPHELLQEYQSILSRTHMSPECRAVLGNIQSTQVIATNIRKIEDKDDFDPLPGYHGSSLYGTKYVSTLLVKEGLTVYDSLPPQCPPLALNMVIYGSKGEHKLNPSEWFDRKRLSGAKAFVPTQEIGEKCSTGYQCQHPLASCNADKICDFVVFPYSHQITSEFNPSITTLVADTF